jgi:hypothetical protein
MYPALVRNESDPETGREHCAAQQHELPVSLTKTFNPTSTQARLAAADRSAPENTIEIPHRIIDTDPVRASLRNNPDI